MIIYIHIVKMLYVRLAYIKVIIKTYCKKKYNKKV